MLKKSLLLTFAIVVVTLLNPSKAAAHCDTMEGPVVKAARTALNTSDVTPILKWIKPGHEVEVREAFRLAMRVRAAGADARELADKYFFETVVRLHRAGEGAPFTGLKSVAPDPVVLAADKALESGSLEKLIADMSGQIAAGLRGRYARVVETSQHADQSVEAGRKYVEAYVELMHYAERLQRAVSAESAHENAEHTD